jgi:hypothetical protein
VVTISMKFNDCNARIQPETVTQTRIHLNASRLNARWSF